MPSDYASYEHRRAKLGVYAKEALASIPQVEEERQKSSSESPSPLKYKKFEERSRLEEERKLLSQYTNTEFHNIFFLKQVHGNRLCYIHKESQKRKQVAPHSYYAQGDALYTQEKEALLVVRTADCLPFFVIMENRRGSLFGLIHAGWRGLKQQIVYTSLGQMLHFLTSEVLEHRSVSQFPREGLEGLQIHCFCGPCAGAERYIVGPEVAQFFNSKSLRKSPQNTMGKILGLPALHTKSRKRNPSTCNSFRFTDKASACRRVGAKSYLLDLPFLAKLQMESALKEYAQLRNWEPESLLKNLIYHKELEACTISQNERFFSHRCRDKGRNLNFIKTIPL